MRSYTFRHFIHCLKHPWYRLPRAINSQRKEKLRCQAVLLPDDCYYCKLPVGKYVQKNGKVSLIIEWLNNHERMRASNDTEVVVRCNTKMQRIHFPKCNLPLIDED